MNGSTMTPPCSQRPMPASTVRTTSDRFSTPGRANEVQVAGGGGGGAGSATGSGARTGVGSSATGGMGAAVAQPSASSPAIKMDVRTSVVPFRKNIGQRGDGLTDLRGGAGAVDHRGAVLAGQ